MKRSHAMWLGGAIGALLGASVAYLLSPGPAPSDAAQKGPSLLAKFEPADAVAIVQIAWSLIRRVQRISGRETARN